MRSVPTPAVREGLGRGVGEWERLGECERPNAGAARTVSGATSRPRAASTPGQRRARRRPREAAEPDFVLRRRVDRAGDRGAVFDQRDIDGEFAVAGEEFARAVERIDQEEPAHGAGDQRGAGGGRLLGDDRRLGGAESGATAATQDRLGAFVGGGDRTAVRSWRAPSPRRAYSSRMAGPAAGAKAARNAPRHPAIRAKIEGAKSRLSS